MPETVVVVTGAFTGPSVERWGRSIADAVARRPGRLVVDLRQSPGVDAAAISVLLQAHRAMVGADGRLTLRDPDSRVRRMLRLAGVERVFDIDEEVQR